MSRSLSIGTATLLLTLTASAVLAASVPFMPHETPRPLPRVQFQSPDGNSLSLDHFRGKPLVFHLWATWCGPCREELPALDRLQAKLADAKLAIVAISLDRQGRTVVQPFFAQAGIKHLQMYTDTAGRLASRVGAPGLPATLLVDAEGREIARHLGAVDWEAPEMEALLRQLSDADVPQPAGALRAATFALAD